jgi:hypothetical protein
MFKKLGVKDFFKGLGIVLFLAILAAIIAVSIGQLLGGF